MEMPNSMTFNTPQINLDSAPSKLPLAFTVSGPVHSRRGSTVAQTLDPNRATGASTSRTSSITYRECLRNHAASTGNYVVDGCGEFMRSGGDGARCAACNCHRSFHRRVEVEGEAEPRRSQIVMEARHQASPVMMSFGGATAESSSEGFVFDSPLKKKKKRFRTKFNQEQKDRMHEFADKLGWRIHKQDDDQVQQFCREVGVRRQVFKVWMHNNKQAMKKRQIL